MIPRTLVPTQLLPAKQEQESKPTRLTSSLDSRTVVPSDLPVVVLDGKSNIPSHIPLEVLSNRMLVPRDIPATPLPPQREIPAHVPLTVLDSRIAVPTDARPAELRLAASVPVEALGDVLEPDVLLTGEVNLLMRPVEERRPTLTLTSQAGTLLFHVLLVSFAVFWPSLFPARAPTQAELELASRSLGMVYLPPSVRNVPREAPRPEPPSAQIKIDPRILKQYAPEVEPSPMPGPAERESAKPEKELPAAPTPQAPAPADQRAEGPREPLKLESPKDQKPTGQLLLPRLSPGRALEDTLRGAAQGGAGQPAIGGVTPLGPGGGGGGGGGGEGYLGDTLQMLTPTEGVDFSNYLARVLASVRRNWYAVIPESARLGEKGRVVLQFRIQRDGTVPFPEPNLMLSSGKEPLDRAAASSIRASSPFEHLPPAFSGPFIELRFIFLYNLPLDYR
jgi:outer membrane biosynthesis protein TonB